MELPLHTNLEAIERLSEEREEENLRFRVLIKTADISGQELDDIVRGYYEYVSSRIDCCACGNCCRVLGAALDAADVARLGEALGVSEGEVVERYLQAEEDGETWRFDRTPCPLLSGNKCTVYAARPDDCRSYPHLHKDRFWSRSLDVIGNAGVCPIVFNVYELLKAELCNRFPEEWEEAWADEWPEPEY